MSAKEGQAFVVGVGCVTSMVAIGLSVTIQYGVLKTIDAPGWIWTLFWIYLPAILLTQAVAQLVKYLSEPK